MDTTTALSGLVDPASLTGFSKRRAEVKNKPMPRTDSAWEELRIFILFDGITPDRNGKFQLSRPVWSPPAIDCPGAWRLKLRAIFPDGDIPGRLQTAANEEH